MRYPKPHYFHRLKTIRLAYLTPCPSCGRRPTQRQLAQRFGVNQATIQRAINHPQALHPHTHLCISPSHDTGPTA